MSRITLFFLVLMLGIVSCKTKSELRREQELERLKQEVSQVRVGRADSEVVAEELRVEMSKLANMVEEQATIARRDAEALRQEMAALTTRIQALEQRAVSEPAPSAPSSSAPTSSGGGGNAYETGKRLFEDGRYDEAIDTLRGASKGKGETARKAHFLMAEALFAAKEYASAALEFSEYRKKFPKDSLVPNAIYRQANAFRSMGKPKEAKLFYQELVDKYPKSSLTGKAKSEMKKLK